MSIFSQSPTELAEIWDKEHVSKIAPSNMRHRDLLLMLDELKKTGVKVEQVGTSFLSRSINQIEFGKGQFKIFLWSQMHGDEPTATPALIDIFTVLQKNRNKDWVKKIESTFTIRAVPMLNPDGAEFYIRRNYQGIDINRDALDLQTPEAQLLKKLRAEWQPAIGFNLHNQNSLTTAGRTNKQAAISFLAVYGDKEKTDTIGHLRNKRLIGAMNTALNQFISGHIGRYGDEWTPTAFGDNFSAWGTPVILIETGGLHSKNEMFLIKMNFVAILTSFIKLADGTESTINVTNYDLIPVNSSGRLVDTVFRQGTLINREIDTNNVTADIALVKQRRRAELQAPMNISQIGRSLSGISGLDEYDASGFNIVGRFQALKVGSSGELLFYKKTRIVDWKSLDIVKEFPPDAIFSVGEWFNGKGVVPKK